MRVFDGFMSGKFLADNRIETAFIAPNAAIAMHVLAHDCCDVRGIGNRHME